MNRTAQIASRIRQAPHPRPSRRRPQCTAGRAGLQGQTIPDLLTVFPGLFPADNHSDRCRQAGDGKALPAEKTLHGKPACCNNRFKIMIKTGSLHPAMYTFKKNMNALHEPGCRNLKSEKQVTHLHDSVFPDFRLQVSLPVIQSRQSTDNLYVS